MTTAKLVIAIALLAPPSTPPQLLVVDSSEEVACRPAPQAWDPAAAFDTATAAAASEDLRRYFVGLNAQFTSILDAVWHGHIRFCTDASETHVLHSLALLVVQPPSEASLDVSGLPGGAEQLLIGLSGAALNAELETVQPVNAAEAARKATALQVVHKARQAWPGVEK
jgi:hypothetical protein